MSNSAKNKTPLLKIRGLKIQGFSDERWHEIIKGVDLTLNRGEVLGLIGESGAGKSTLGLAAMGYTQPGCRITSGSIYFEGIDLTQLSDEHKRSYWGNRMTYVAQFSCLNIIHDYYINCYRPREPENTCRIEHSNDDYEIKDR